MKQRSEEWFEVRKGKFTASNIYKICGKSIDTQTAETYILEKLSERLGVSTIQYQTDSMRWGEETEPLAFDVVNKFEKFKESTFKPYNDYFGGSPDGVNTEKILEIKCPYNPVEHLRHLKIINGLTLKQIKPEYYWQIQANMLVFDRQKALFASFDPRLNHEKLIHMVVIERDLEASKLILERVQQATLILNEYLELLNLNT